jgi:hypothetical protein
MVQLRCFDRVDLSVSVHTTAMVLLRWFLLREIGFSVHTTAMANSDGPTAMLLPSRFELFCSYNCDGQLRWFLIPLVKVFDQAISRKDLVDH